MAKISRQELENALFESRLCNGNDTPPRLVKPRDMGQLERRIYDALKLNARAMTRAEIAESLGLKKTPYLTAQIEGLVQRGVVERNNDVWRNGCLMFRYSLVQGV